MPSWYLGEPVVKDLFAPAKRIPDLNSGFSMSIFPSIRSKVKYFRFHPFRHFTASILDDLGIPIGTIQRILGHENRKTTEGYLHSIGEAERKAMLKFESVDLYSPGASENSNKEINKHKEYWLRKTDRPDHETLVKRLKNWDLPERGKNMVSVIMQSENGKRIMRLSSEIKKSHTAVLTKKKGLTSYLLTLSFYY